MANDDDTTLAAEADDTLVDSEGQDTLAADDAQDTAAGSDADDTVAGAAGDDDAADATPAKPPRSTRIKVEGDALDTEFDQAIQAIDKDDMMTPGQRAAEKVRLKADREKRQRDREKDARDNEETLRNTEAARHGVTRQVFDETWDDACKESEKELGYFSHDAAKLVLKQKISAAGKKPAPAPSAKPRSAAAPKVDQGARLSPPGGAGGRVSKPQLSAEDAFDQGEWSMPN